MLKESLNLPSTYVKQNEQDTVINRIYGEIQIKKAVKTLICLSSSSIDADQTIRDFNPELRGEETIELLEKKYNYVQNLFGIKDDPISFNRDETPRDKVAGDYYSLLSVVGLPGFTVHHGHKNKPQTISLPQEEYTVE
jgi:hypothetical protein